MLAKVEEGREELSKEQIDQNWFLSRIKKRVCTTFVDDSFSNGAICQCGNSRESHTSVTLNDYFSTAVVSHWDSAQHTSEVPTDAFGEVKFIGASTRNSYFVRLSCDTPPSIVYSILTEQWGLQPPNMVISVDGGIGRSKVKTWVREVLRQGLVRATQSTGAWIISGGLRDSVNRTLGEAVREHATAGAVPMVAINISPWGLVQNRKVLVNPEGSFPVSYFISNTSRDSCLDSNYKAFLLVDDGSKDRGGGDAGFKARLEDYLSHQRTGKLGSGSVEIPVLCLLISGEPSILERLDLSLKKSIPWLILAGSGGLADLLCDIVENVSAASNLSGAGSECDPEAATKTDIRGKVTEHVLKHFPSEQEPEKLVDKVLSIYQNKDLISIYHGEEESPDDFDTVLLNALVRSSKQRLSGDPRLKTVEMKLAIMWNRMDIARNELTEDIRWKVQKNDLEALMTDALVNNKPEFVRLFTENGLNILEYLTYGRLEELYCSISEGLLIHTLLQRYLLERQSSVSFATPHPAASQLNHAFCSGKDFTLYEVSVILEYLLGDVCEPFYRKCLDLDGITSKRKSFKKFTRVLQDGCSYRAESCFDPWAALFIWAVLQNRSEMAIYFWELTSESVLSALGACKLLRELSKLESEAEMKASMKELASKFENLAHDVFSQCYECSESRAFILLKKTSEVWKGTTCLKMAMEADARYFFSHDGVQSLLSQIWWGDMDKGTEVWKLILTLFIPPLCYTRLISFREEQDEESGMEKWKPESVSLVKDAEWLNADTVYSFSHIKQMQTKQEESIPMKPNRKDNVVNPIQPKRPYVLSRWRQFWYAPVTAFLGNVIMYFLFLLLFAYVLLANFKPPPPHGPAIWELVLYFWVLTIICEEIRQTLFMGNLALPQRIRLYLQDMWHRCDLIAITMFLIGICFRMFEQTFWVGRSALSLDYMVFALRLIHIFAIHKQLGPKIIIVSKMMKDVFFFLFFLAVWLLAYGVATQALIYPYDPNVDRILRRLFYRPYLYIFGQIPVEEVDSGVTWNVECTTNTTLIDEGMEPCGETQHNWIVVILLVVFLLITNILLINLLIAMFSYTFNKVQDRSDTYWKFQRYNLIVEYHSRPCLAPPFIIFSHIHLFIKRNIRNVKSQKVHHFSVVLDDKGNNRLMKWENIQKENFLSAEGKKQRGSDAERLKRMSTKVDGILRQTAEIRDVDRRLRSLETEMEFCSSTLVWMVEALSQSGLLKAAKPPPTRKASPCSSES